MSARDFYRRLHQAVSGAEGRALTYYGKDHGWPELYARTRDIHAALAGRRQQSIILCGNKSLDSYAAIFAILFGNNIWVPVHPSLPAPRFAQVLAMTGAGLILTDAPLPDELAAAAAAAGVAVQALADIPASDAALELAEHGDDDVAYVMFTSGSTGVPKGVPMTHANYINFVDNCMDILSFSADDVFSDYHDWAFDISVFYLFCWPLAQATIAPVIEAGDRMMPLRFIEKNGVTVWSSVPSVIGRIRKLYPNRVIETRLRLLFLCGEPFALPVLAYCYDNLRAPLVYNFYGLTETGVENFHHRCSREDLTRFEAQGHVPIGAPLPGNDVRQAEDGELLLAGCQVTPGYLGGVGADRFQMIDGTRWYLTGDLVERVGEFWFCKGRKDSQVKLRGYRVEMMDIEVNIRRHCGVDDAVCFVAERKDKQVLVAVAKRRDGCPEALPEARERLAPHLPAYMLPDAWSLVDDLPVNANGKIDRKAVAARWSAATP